MPCIEHIVKTANRRENDYSIEGRSEVDFGTGDRNENVYLSLVQCGQNVRGFKNRSC